MCCFACFYKGSFAIIIWVELASGLVASTGTAFFSNEVNVWGYVIFVVDVAFASWLLYYTGKEVCVEKTKDFTLNWICGMCSVVTMALFGAVFWLTTPPKDLLIITFAVYITAILYLWLVATCYVIFLRLGLVNNDTDTRRPVPKGRGNNEEKKASGTDPEKDGGRTMEQSLEQIMNHVQNNPTQKTYRMYAVGSEAPFDVTVPS